MKPISKLWVWSGAFALLSLFLSQSVRAEIVYDDSATRSTPPRFAQVAGIEFGDEIRLNTTATRVLTNFAFEYYGLNFSGGDETLRFRIYRNDAVYGTNFYSPGTLLYDSGAFSIGATAGSTLTFDDLYLPVPTNFTWTVQFGGITAPGESAGLSLYDPPTVGSNPVDYWEHSGTNGTWQLFGPSGPPLNFGARAQAAATVVDSLRPAVVISTPAGLTNVFNNPITVTGTAADPSPGRVALVLVKVGNGPFLPATGTTNWTISLTLPTPGSNIFTAKAVDAAGNESALQRRSIFFAVPSTLTRIVNGSGTVVGPTNGEVLYINRYYTLTATPASGWLFSNYMRFTTNVATTSIRYSFLMETNLVITVNFATNRFNFAQGDYNGLFWDPNGVAHESSGFFTIKVTSAMSFSGKLRVAGESLSCSGVFDQSGYGTLKKLIYRKGYSPLALTVQLLWDGSERITGVVSNCVPGGWSAAMLGDKDVYSKKATPTKWTGPTSSQRYTMILDTGVDPAAEPGGYGYGCVSLGTNGQVKVTNGSLGDGQKFRPYTTVVSKNGEWPLYAMMYKDAHSYFDNNGYPRANVVGKGSIIGWMQFTNYSVVFASTNRDLLAGSLIWNKTGWPTNPIYPAGFTNLFAVAGSPYYKPPTYTNSMLLSGQVAVENSDGNLAATFINLAVLNNANRFDFLVPVYNDQKLFIVTGTGELKGSFLHPNNTNTAAPTKTWGAILQDENMAYGHFVGTNLTGSVRVRPN